MRAVVEGAAARRRGRNSRAAASPARARGTTPASSIALSPVMSLLKPGRNTTVGPRPSSCAQASSTPSPRSSRPLLFHPRSLSIQPLRDIAPRMSETPRPTTGTRGYPVVLQVLPALEGGGVERGTVEITQAIAARRGQRAGGQRRRPAGRRGRAGRRAALQLPLDLEESRGGSGATPRALAALIRARACRHRACPLARAGLVGLARRPAHRRAFRHHLPRRLRRGPARQAPLQRGDGARRAGDRHQPLHRRPDHAPATASTRRASA